jgi:hypothetical protein
MREPRAAGARFSCNHFFHFARCVVHWVWFRSGPVVTLPTLPVRAARAVLLLAAFAYWSPGTAEAGCTHLPTGFKPLESYSDTGGLTDTDPLHAPECSANEHSLAPTPPPPELVRQALGLLASEPDPNAGLTFAFPRARDSGSPLSRPSGVFHPPRHG